MKIYNLDHIVLSVFIEVVKLMSTFNDSWFPLQHRGMSVMRMALNLDLASKRCFGAILNFKPGLGGKRTSKVVLHTIKQFNMTTTIDITIIMNLLTVPGEDIS